MFKYGVFSGPYFPVFGLNTEIYRVKTDQRKLRIWTLFKQGRVTRSLNKDKCNPYIEIRELICQLYLHYVATPLPALCEALTL